MTDLETRFRRHALLRILAEEPDRKHNLHVLQRLLDLAGLPASLDLLRAELSWLQEMGLLETDDACGILCARITARGVDVAMGRTKVPGVESPGPA